MSWLIRIRLFGLLVTMVMAVSTVTVGFAHHAPTVSEAQLTAYVMSGGQLSDLCGDDSMLGGADCPLCHLADQAVVPTPTGLSIDLEHNYYEQVIAPRQIHAARDILDSALGLRGPPAA